jgi:hypothetical protein
MFIIPQSRKINKLASERRLAKANSCEIDQSIKETYRQQPTNFG